MLLEMCRKQVRIGCHKYQKSAGYLDVPRVDQSDVYQQQPGKTEFGGLPPNVVGLITFKTFLVSVTIFMDIG